MRTRKIVITPELWAEAERIRRETPRGEYSIVTSCVVSQAVRKQWRKGNPRANQDSIGYRHFGGPNKRYMGVKDYRPTTSENAALLRSIVKSFDNYIPYPFAGPFVTITVRKHRG